ncbi:hypothetical protein B0H15DRAFT_951985 [Mycena belliarum]|uniref:Uncharacterized protein n=1 Tax=Mycena belliarum TaxID=1033014 RepID=A0AAD6U168_9AGAR|nr:hypothetical protein B0H15DRAFT_951985 [Mycena belliae]
MPASDEDAGIVTDGIETPTHDDASQEYTEAWEVEDKEEESEEDKELKVRKEELDALNASMSRTAQKPNSSISISTLRSTSRRQLQAKEQQYKARKRANSEATEMPLEVDMPTESFSEEIVVDGVRFHAVKVFHPRAERLGTSYAADPVCDDVHASLPLQLYADPVGLRSAVHAADLVQRGISPDCIGITSRCGAQKTRKVKLTKTAFYTRLLDLHHSSPTPESSRSTPTISTLMGFDIGRDVLD